MLYEVKGLVLRTTDIGDTDRMITLYTESMGIVSAMAKGARSLKSRKMAAAQQFCYSSMVLFEQGDKLWVREASLIESFFDLRSSIEGLALAGYIVEVIGTVATAEGDKELLRLALNSLYAISSARFDLNKVKAAFEIRTAAHIGFMPDVLGCARCGVGTGEFFFNIMAGAIECADCHHDAAQMHETLTESHESHILCPLSPGAKDALVYCVHCPSEKLFSFNIPEEDMRLFCRAAESYLCNHLERGFRSLDFYNEVKG
ncbi:MAG: DNA repair protein RecO [Clostridia bacterium]|nr:DNA repair protein RecO [Clostridia bacterium]